MLTVEDIFQSLAYRMRRLKVTMTPCRFQKVSPNKEVSKLKRMQLFLWGGERFDKVVQPKRV